VITKLDLADVIASVVKTRNECDRILNILIQDDGSAIDTCPHPVDQIEHEETMDDEAHPYRCRACGATQPVPFHTVQPGS
jgi:hypothetical protein